MRGRAPTVSPYEVDPLSWFTGPLVPISFAFLGLAYGLILSALTWNDTVSPAWMRVRFG